VRIVILIISRGDRARVVEVVTNITTKVYISDTSSRP
jgi:hypothetical protein